MPRRRVTGGSPTAHTDAYLSKVGSVADLKPRRHTAAERAPNTTIHVRDPRLDMSRRSRPSSQTEKLTTDSGDQWSMRQALKAYQTNGDQRNSSRKLPPNNAAGAEEEDEAEDSSSTSSSERSDKSSVSGTSSMSSEIPSKGRPMQHHVTTYDTQPMQRASGVRSQAEHQNSPRPAPATLEQNVTGADVEERSASPESSHRSISSSDSQAEAPSATARATKRPGPNSITEVHSSAKKRASENNSLAESGIVNEPLQQQKSSSASHRSRSAVALDRATPGGVERGQKSAPTNDKDLLTSARPMDRYERVERYLEHNNILPTPPPSNTDPKTPQQSRQHRRHKHSSQVSVDEPAARKAAVRAAMPAKLLRDAAEQSSSENEFDNNQNDIKHDSGKKRHRHSGRSRSAKKHRRHRSSAEHVKYSFPPFDEPITKTKKHKRRGKARYESPSSLSSSSSKNSHASENSTPPPPPPPPQQQRAHRKHHETVEQRHRRHHTVSVSSSDSSRSSQSADNKRQRSVVAVARAGSVDSIMPTIKNHKVAKFIEHNSFAVPKRPPDGGGHGGRRSRNQMQAAATVSKSTAQIIDIDENENVINEADKDQWRKYFADLYTFNMLQKIKSAKKHKSKRHQVVDMDIDTDDDDAQNTFHPPPPAGDANDVFGSVDSHQLATTTYNAPYGNGSLPHTTELYPPPTWPGLASKPNAAPAMAVDDVSGRQTLLGTGPNEPIPLFALNLSAFAPTVKEVLASKLFCDVCDWRAETPEAFEDHLLKTEHRMAEMSATPEAMAALAKKIQTRQNVDNTVKYYCHICDTTTLGTHYDHRRNEDHKKKAGTAKRGCLLCMTGSFATYGEWRMHMESEEHQKKKIELDLEHQARKSGKYASRYRKPAETTDATTDATTTAGAAGADASRSKPAEDIEADAVEQITLDDMFVIDSAGEYSVSGDEAPVPGTAGGDDSGTGARMSKRDTAADAHRRKDFQLYLSYLRSVDCNYHEVSASKEDDEADDLRMDLDDESETTSPVGADCMVEVTGVFCCACRELWQDRQQALTKHCASEKHRQNYEKLRLSTQSQSQPAQESDNKGSKSSVPAVGSELADNADNELADDVVQVPQLSVLAELDDDAGEGLLDDGMSDKTEEL